ncbi:hypothetical protein [Dactylosporangium sp. NPDC048998]|uniref:hypothetical protein n=1 Tax=Dactylosporangium sp. NPDC048998 TaxID=3363976 RepID=UPI00371D5455
MVVRPTAVWRANVARDAANVAAGTLRPEDANAAILWSDDMIRETDKLLEWFEADVAGLVEHRWEPATDAEILEVVERTVVALNAANDSFEEIGYETDEREQLREYIERVLMEARIDPGALARRNGMLDDDITAEWRRW